MRNLRLSPTAQAEFSDILDWSEREFGASAALRYDKLLRAALHDLSENPTRPGVRRRDDIAPGACIYHMVHSRARAGGEQQTVRRPRHLFLFRVAHNGDVDISRILHDAMDISRHVPSEFFAAAKDDSGS